jgi:O-methyltransferase involved in polyketide biosynthesis
MVAYRRTFTDIPFSHEIFKKLGKIIKQHGYKKMPEYLKKPELAPQFEARYKLINKSIYRTRYNQILELASGFAPRGLSMSVNDHFNYVEVDLPSVIKEKKQIVKEIADSNNFAMPKNLHFVSGNVLELKTFEKAIKYFDKSKPLIIVNEGLLRYMTKKEKAKVAKNIHKILTKFNGVWITSDISIKKIFRQENKIMNKYIEKVSKLTGKDLNTNRFETEKEAIKFFENLGFSIKKHSTMEIHNDLTSSKKLKLSEKQTKDTIEGLSVLVMKPI